MDIKVINDVKSQECDILVINMFEGKQTSNDIANVSKICESKNLIPIGGRDNHKFKFL